MKNKRVYDLSNSDNTVTSRLIPILQNLSNYKTINELKNDFTVILDDETTSVSKEKIYEYKTNMKKYYDINKLGIYISNIILNGSALGMERAK